MKFYEVQPALEAGKKITHSHLNGKFLSIEKEDANIFGKTLVLTISDHSREIGYSLDMFDLFADDWEIVEENTIDSKLLSHKKYYYEAMAVYYSVDHSNTNKSEAIIEANLVDKIEYAFLEAINRRELSEIEKNQIRAEHARYFQMWADAENDSKEWLETYKCELMKFPEFNDD